MNRASLRNIVLQNTNRKDKIDLINSAFDLALTEMAQQHDFHQNRLQAQIDMPIGSNTVTMPDDVFQVLNVRLVDTTSSINSRTIILEDKAVLTKQWPNLAVTIQSWPKYAFVDWETNLLTFLPPTSQEWTATVEYFRLFPQFVNDLDAIGRNLEAALIAYATSYIFKSIQMFQEATFWFTEYQRSLLLAIRADSRTNTQRQMQGHKSHFIHGDDTVPPWLDPFNRGSDF